MINYRQLAQMSQQSMEDVRREDLVDISGIEVNKTLSPEQKMSSFLEQVRNPYCFLCGETPVRVCFSDSAPSLGKLLANFFIHLKQR